MKRTCRVFAAALAAAMLCAAPVQAAEWKQDHTGWWYQNDDGSYPADSWQQIGGTWYYFGDSGYMLTGWQQIGGQWYFLNGDGSMAANRWEGNYYLGQDGAMLTNTMTPDGYQVGADGAWVQTQAAQTAANIADGVYQSTVYSDGGANVYDQDKTLKITTTGANSAVIDLYFADGRHWVFNGATEGPFDNGNQSWDLGNTYELIYFDRDKALQLWIPKQGTSILNGWTFLYFRKIS